MERPNMRPFEGGTLQTDRFRNGNHGRYFLESPNFSYWNNTKDDILLTFKREMAIAEQNRGTDTGLKTLQRFAELVDMIMYLQSVPFFGQYWYYGCWCAPEGFLNHVKDGYGHPVDDIDKSCRSMSYCYECAKIDFSNEDCTSGNVNYRWHGFLNDKGEKTLSCDDEENTCARTICMCDKKLAENLKKHEKVWNLHNHQKWGEFKRDFECFPQNTHFDDASDKANARPSAGGGKMIDPETGEEYDDWGLQSGWEKGFGRSGAGMVDIPSLVLKSSANFGVDKTCCGEFPDRIPIKKTLDNGKQNKQKCCNDRLTYNDLTQCCSDNKVYKIADGMCHGSRRYN